MKDLQPMTARSAEVANKFARPDDAGRDHPDEMSRAHHALRRAIMHGDLRAGDPLSQVELARQLGVSRGPFAKP